MELFMVGEQDIILIEVYDADDNVVENYTGTVVISVIKGEMDVENGSFYNFTPEDRGQHSFIVTPLTFGENSTTLLFEDIEEGIQRNVTLSVVGGPVKSLEVQMDWENMDWEGPKGSYYAGDELYFTVIGTDKMGNPSSTYDAPIIVTHDFKTNNKDLVPEPWWSNDGDMILDMVDGVASSFPDQPIKLYSACEVNLTFRSKINLEGIEGYNKKISVRPTYLDHLETLPGGPDAAPKTVDVKVGASQLFSVKGFDEFDNPVEIESATWRVDSNIKAMGSSDILVDGEFKAIEYFESEDAGVVFDTDLGYSTRNGTVDVTVVCLRDQRKIKRDISVRVLNDKDVWLDADKIEPEHFLWRHDMELQTNIYYDMPVIDPGSIDQSSALGDIFEIAVIVTLVEKDGEELVELVNEQVSLIDLNTNPKGIKIFNVIVPWENFSDHIKRWEDGDDDTKNFIRVELRDVPGETNMSDFEKAKDNNVVIVELYAVTPSSVGHPEHRGGSGDGFLNPNNVDFFIKIIIMLFFLFILVILVAVIYKLKAGTGKERDVLPDTQARKNPEINGVNLGMKNEPREKGKAK